MVAKNTPVGREPAEIGRRAHVIRRHLGLVAGLAGLRKDHLSIVVIVVW